MDEYLLKWSTRNNVVQCLYIIVTLLIEAKNCQLKLLTKGNQNKSLTCFQKILMWFQK